jgi:hypothetical protein
MRESDGLEAQPRDRNLDLGKAWAMLSWFFRFDYAVVPTTERWQTASVH